MGRNKRIANKISIEQPENCFQYVESTFHWIPSESPRSIGEGNGTLTLTILLGGYHLWRSQDDNRTAST